MQGVLDRMRLSAVEVLPEKVCMMLPYTDLTSKSIDAKLSHVVADKAYFSLVDWLIVWLRITA